MKVVVYIILLTLLGINSCIPQDRDNCHYKKIQEYKKLKKGETIYSPGVDGNFIGRMEGPISLDKKTTIIFDILNKSMLCFADTSTHEIYHIIDLPNAINAFHVFGKDSILILENAKNDSSLFLCDYEGNIYKRFFLADTCYPASSPFVNMQIIDNNRIFFPVSFYGIAKSPTMAYYDLSKEKLVLSHASIPDFPSEDKIYPDEYYDIYPATFKNGNPVFVFGFSHSVYEWDIDNDTVLCHPVTTCLMDTIKALPSKGLDIHYTNAHIRYLQYNKFRKQYYLVTTLSKAYKYNGVRYITTLLDSNFKVIAEGFNSQVLGENNIVTKNYSMHFSIIENIIHCYYSDFPKPYGELNIDSMRHILDTAYNPKLDPIRLLNCEMKARKDSGKNIDITPLIDSLIPNQPDSFIAVFIHTDKGCGSCSETVIQFFAANTWLAKRNDWYLIDVYRDKTIADNRMAINGLNKLPQVILTEENWNTAKHFLWGNNPRLTIVKHGKVIFDKIYQYEPPTHLLNKVMEYYSSQFSGN